MRPDEFIERNIFNQLALRAFPYRVCEACAREAVSNWKQHRSPSGVRFNELLAEAVDAAGSPAFTGHKNLDLFRLIVQGRVRLFRVNAKRKTWVAEVLNDDGSVLGRSKFPDQAIRRAFNDGFLRADPDWPSEKSGEELHLLPAERLAEWVPIDQQRV